MLVPGAQANSTLGAPMLKQLYPLLFALAFAFPVNKYVFPICQ